MEITFAPALDFTLAELADALTTAFRDYYMEVHFTPQGVGQMVRCDSVDLGVSRCVLLDGMPVGVALIARRGWTSRLAAMGLNTDLRGQGVGRRVMDLLVAEAVDRGERAMMLEVIEQNAAALKLYTAIGFQRVRRLVGYATEPKTALEEKQDVADYAVSEAYADGLNPSNRLAASRNGLDYGELEEVDLRSIANALALYGPPDLPWQLSGETLAQQGPPNRGYRLHAAFAALSNPANSQVAIRAVCSSAPCETRQQERRLLHALIMAYPGKIWKVPPIFPEEMAAALFEPLGFRRESVTQLQMVCRL